LDVADAFKDAKGEVHLQAIVTATNAEGLDESTLELSVREVIDQNGLEVEWEE